MLTPKFTISQDDEFIILIIRVPYVKVSSAEMEVIDGLTFKFYLKPYFLNLTFQQRLQEGDPSSAVYDHNTYDLTLKLKKATPGETFNDLDMITKLFKKSEKTKSGETVKKKKKTPLIEVIGEVTHETTGEEVKEDNKSDDLIRLPKKSYNYGFNRQYEKVLEDLVEERFELFEVNPEGSTEEERLALRDQLQRENFDEDHYLADLFDDDQKKEILYMQGLAISPPKGEYTKEEWDCLVRLPNKEYLIGSIDNILAGLVDILYAYCYEARVTESDFSSESAWTVNKLSSLLSCGAVDTRIDQVVLTSVRRALVYPMIRNFDFALKVIEDTQILVRSGKVSILKALLAIKYLFERSEPRYLLNTLYIDDYCIYIQSVQEDKIASIGSQIKEVKIKKQDIGYELDELEEAGLEVLKEDLMNTDEEDGKKEGHDKDKKPEIIMD